MSEHNPNGPGSGAVPHDLIDLRDDIAAAIQRNVEVMQSYTTIAPDYQGADNVQGVAIGQGGSDSGGTPGAPVVTVYLAETARSDDARSVLVDAMQVRSAGDMPMRFVTSGVMEALGNMKELRPAPGGFSVGSFRLRGSGTLGCLAKDADGRVLCLSNNHVLANLNSAKKGEDCISQPARGDGGRCPAGKIATLQDFVELKFDGTANDVDCATGVCPSGAVSPKIGYTKDGFEEDVQYITINDDTTAPALQMQVEKSGRTTGLTRGIITGIHWYGVVKYAVGRWAFFKEQIVVNGLEDHSFAQPGDSGSCIWNMNDHKPVGLLFAGNAGHTLANPMSTVLNELDITLYTS